MVTIVSLDVPALVGEEHTTRAASFVVFANIEHLEIRVL